MTLRNKVHITMLALLILSFAAYAMSLPQDDKTRQKGQGPQPREMTPGQKRAAKTDEEKAKKENKMKVLEQAILDDEDSIPDSLLHPRWGVQRTMPIVVSDLDQNATDLIRPDNIKQDVEYNDTLGYYIFGNKMAGTYIQAPLAMTYQEYLKWSEKQLFDKLFRAKNDAIFEAKGKEKFDFTDMHFDLGPAEKIFGPGGVRVTTQGTAELKFGATMKNTQNPSLPIKRRKTTTIDFDEKINANISAKVGDKVNMNLNYNTDATFSYDAQNMKLKYDGKEDEIIKLLEAGNVSFPSNSSLVRGASSLFGIRTDLQFGKLKLQTVVSQKKSTAKSVNSQGGTQLTPFEIDAANYDENRHFFLAHYFHDKYDDGMKTLPNVTSGITINRVEIWVNSTTGTATNTRDLIALTDLGEGKHSKHTWGGIGSELPSNNANLEYATLVNLGDAARSIDEVAETLESPSVGMEGGIDYEKVAKARLLTSSEYSLNSGLGYVTLNSGVKTDQVLAVAFEYTYRGETYQVGEFSADITDVNKALFVKSLKNVSNNPTQGNWRLMMKNVYKIGSTLQKEKFRLDIKFQSDTAGVYLSYIPEPQVKSQMLIKFLGADRLDNNNKAHSNGYFDYVEGYTVRGGYVFLPDAEPFGDYMYRNLIANGVSEETAKKYAFTELYDSTKTVAKQIAEKDKYILTGQYKGSRENVISAGATNIPQGSVVVTAAGVELTEGSDYTVDYNSGEVTILNQSLIDAKTDIQVSVESNDDYGQIRKTMFGLNWEYDFSKDFMMSGTFQHLSEQANTTKVNMGSEPLNNTMIGLNLNWKKESQWLTNVLNAVPFLHVTQPSNISLKAEFAKLIAGQSHGTQDNASYLDDFENTKSTIDVGSPSSWILSSVPSRFSESQKKDDIQAGYNRSLLAWYYIDPLFTRRSSSLTPAHIKSDLEQLSNHYVREVYVRELYPNRDQSSYSGATSTLSVLNLAYYPNERGPYNFNPQVADYSREANGDQHWGGMMRKLETTDFETANIAYIEFWMLDPFIYSRRDGTAKQYKGKFYIDLGDVSEDVLHDGKKFQESGMSVDGSDTYDETNWGKVPRTTIENYAFATTDGSREKQDVGFNGLTDEEELNFDSYQTFLQNAQAQLSQSAWDSVKADPANDDYQYFRSNTFDERKTSILDRYKRINNPQGNSPDSKNRDTSYDTSYKTTPDVEDINQDHTMNEYEKYYEYEVDIDPDELEVGQNYIVDKRVTAPKLRNGNTEEVTWYQFRIPVDNWTKKFGTISDFTSLRFMRMYLTGFEKPIVLRFGSFDLVRGEWRVYEQNLDSHYGTGRMDVSAVNIEENNDKTPVNYTLPPGISRNQDPTQPQLVEENEQALAMTLTDLSTNQSKCVYKNTTVDMRQYKRIQMFAHANAMDPNTTNLADNQLALFVRLGSDYKNNYYEYEIPLSLTAPGHYDQYSVQGCKAVWPEDNMLDVALKIFTNLKKNRNKQKALGLASYNKVYSEYDEDHPNNKVSILGNPTLGEVKTMIIGVRNLSGEAKSGEVWVNELRLLEYDNSGGWAASGNLNLQLSDFGTVTAQGKYTSQGFGGLEDGVASRATDDKGSYAVTASFELGKFFPDKAKVTAPLYYSVQKEESKPKYNPLDTDMLLKDALESAADSHERDSIESIAVTKTLNTNFSLSNVRVGIANKKHPTPVDPANFSFSYSHSHKHTSGETTIYENEDTWRGTLDYAWTPVYKAFEPFKKVKSKSKWLDMAKQMSFNWLPQNVTFGSDINRSYYELQERDVESTENSKLPLTFSEQFLWNRDFSIRWDFTKNIHMNFNSATHAEIEEPYTPINKELYLDHYQAWKDSVWTSIKNFGKPLDYAQSFSLSIQSPLDKLPILDWTKLDASYKANYTWTRGSDLEDGTSLGNTITNNRDITINGTINLEKLYNHIPFLKKVNDDLNKDTRKTQKKTPNKKLDAAKKAGPNDKAEDEAQKQKKALPTNKKGFEKEITILPDSVITVNHARKTKRIIVTAKTADGKYYPIKWKTNDDNTIRILNKVDSAMKVKISVQAKEPLDDKPWYKALKVTTRLLMAIRNVSISYSEKQSMSLPGYTPMAGKAFGQNKENGFMAPGFGFAFGLEGEEFLQKAHDRNWLLCSDSVSTPAAISNTSNLTLKMTLEPWKNFKIDLNAARSWTQAKSIQYMYDGMPTTRTGTFSMTTISIGSAFQGSGNANNGYYNKTFEKFCNLIPTYQDKVNAQYEGSTYPFGEYAGQKFDAEAKGGVGQYSADVLIPAFLNAYTTNGGGNLAIFPSIAKLLPNWSLKFSGLSKLPWIRDHFKSVNLNHSYKSVYAVGSYSSFSTFQEYMNGLGFISDATTGNALPNSMYNISTVSINEAFSPLIGLDFTFMNNMTLKAEYKTTRILTLSTTSVQLNEANTHDFVIGWGYKWQNFKLFGGKNHRAVKSNKKNTDEDGADNKQQSNAKSDSKKSSAKGQVNHDLNLRCDISYRQMASICRDIASMTSSASSGSTAIKLSFTAEYTLTKLVTMSFYYDMQKNIPLLSSSSYPTVTQDFGLSIKFSLKR